METQTTNVMITVSPKSQGISFLLTFLFGPLGLFYSTVLGAVIMLILGGIITVVTLGIGAIPVWLVSIIWGAIAVNYHNAKLLGGSHTPAKPMTDTRKAERDWADETEEATKVTEEDREEYAPGLSLKSDEELKAIIQDEKLYDPLLITLAREELTERVVGKRRQRTQEELRREEEERRQRYKTEEQEQQRRKEEERLRLLEEQERQKQQEQQERLKVDKWQSEKQKIQLLSLGKIRYGWLLALGIGIFFGGYCIAYLLNFFGEIFSTQLSESGYYNLFWTIRSNLGHLTDIGLIFYLWGITKTLFHPQNKEQMGAKFIFFSLLVYGIMCVALSLSYLFELPFTTMMGLGSSLSICMSLLALVTWILCTMGFIRIGTKSSAGYFGKRGATFLVAATGIFAGTRFLYLLLTVFCNTLRESGILLEALRAIVLINAIASLACIVLMWKGWTYLLSSWEEENSNA